MGEITARLSTALADRYGIERRLGEGGMATVYLAEELKHHRKVAIKVLKPELAAVLGAERFVQEIKTTAHLQHPHILPLFDSGEADGFLYYVMPFVDGETVREKLNRETQFGVDEAVRIATEVADALDYAHRHDVIHRDIKPENILLHDGRPMVADFGIALAVSAAAGGRMTETGMSLGTPHYMSPEQATAEKDLTNRSDIYSLGCVLYEMLTGEPPHTGASAVAIVAKIVTDEVRPVEELRKSVPPNVAAATARALEKLPADRFDSAAHFAEALTNPAFVLTGTPAIRAELQAPVGWRQRLAIPLAVLATLMLVLAVWGPFRAPAPSGTPTRMTIPVPDGYQMQLGFSPRLAISPDGRTLVYYTDGLLHVRSLDSFDDVPLAGTKGAEVPFFSPDGQWIGFSRSGLKRIAVEGGPVLPIVDKSSSLGVDWGAEGNIVYVPGFGSQGLWLMADDGSGSRQITTVVDSALETVHVWPQLLPDGKSVLFTVLGPSGGWVDASLVVQDIASGERRAVIEGATYGRYVSTGHIVYAQADGTILAVPFDLGRFRVTGAPLPVASEVRVAGWGGAASVAVSDGGTLAFLRGTNETRFLMNWLDRDGTVVRQLGPPLNGGWQRVSPDGRRIAFTLRRPNHNDIWLADVASGRRERFTFESSEDEIPMWSPDGQRVAYSSAWTGLSMRIYAKPVDGSSEAELIYTGAYHPQLTDWSPDGKWLAFYQLHPETGQDIWLVSTDGEGQLVPVVTTAGVQMGAVFSPDGRWITYHSNESGRPEVYAVSFPELGSRVQISADGGRLPHWNGRGDELFYVTLDGDITVMSVSTQGRTLSLGTPETLFRTPLDYPGFDVSPDGQNFVVLIPNPDAPAREIRVVLNWFEELKAQGGN
jgi:eukaryotic-like serine/threonine-protein kinase